MTDSPPAEPDEHFLSRLRRRKVVQWGLAYSAFAWLMLQILALVAESYDWPHSVMRAAIAIAVSGLGLVVTVAWFHGDRGAQRIGGVEMAVLAAIALLGGGLASRTFTSAEHAPVAATPPPSTATAQVDSQPSIAVLPFENRSTGTDDSFFADGMHDDILTQLSRIGALRVISRNSVERFRKTELGSRQIAAQLGVSTLLVGGVQRLGNHVRISTQLIDARNDTQLWAETYDRELTAANVFSIQSEVAEAIVGALKASLTPQERERSKRIPTQNLDAWKFYQLGRQQLAQRTAAGFVAAEADFRKAIAADPSFAAAQAGLSESLSIATGYSNEHAEQQLAQSGAAAEQAMKLDPSLPEAWVAAGLVAQSTGKFDDAEGYFRRAIELDPSHAAAHKFYASLLFGKGHFVAGEAQMALAAKLDPMSAIIQVNLGDLLEARGKTAAAEACFRRGIQLDPALAPAYGAYAGFLAESSARAAEAEPFLVKHAELDPDSPGVQLALADYYLDLGDRPRFETIVANVIKRWPQSADAEAAQAWLATMNGDWLAAKLHAGRVHEQNPTDPEALASLRNVYLQEGKPEKALELYMPNHSALVLPGTPKVTYRNTELAIDVAVVLQRLGRAERARELVDAAAASLKDRPRLGKVLGYGIDDVMILALSGNRTQALARLREAQRAGWHRYWLYFRDVEPALDSIRGDPEFKAVFYQIERDTGEQRKGLAVRAAGS